MDNEKIDKLLELITEIAGNADMPYHEKRQAILARCRGEERGHLIEFCAWFDGTE